MIGKNQNIKSNIWKFFLFSLTQRRHYIPILAIFFLTLPDTTAKQIGFYTAAGYLASFFLEIPSGYISDKIGHKKALIIAKIMMVLSTIFFIYANSLIYFIIGSIFLSGSIAFVSGTSSAFMHNTLIQLKKEKDYVKITSKIAANVSIFSAILILLLPLFTKISIVFPLKINLFIDIIGLIVVFTLISPKEKIESKDEENLPLLKQLKKLGEKGFYSFSIFFGILIGFLFAAGSYKYVYLESLGFPIIFIGTVMAASRIVWFILGHQIHKLKDKYGIKKMIKFEIILFPLVYILIAILKNPYVIGGLLALSTGYFWARGPIIGELFLKNYCKNKKYKATILSVKAQIGTIFMTIFSFGIGFLMAISYKQGYFIASIILFILLVLSYLDLRKYLK